MKKALRFDEFILHITFDSKIETSKAMTLNQLVDIMNKRFDQIEKRLDAHDVILQEHSELFKHNNLK